MTTIHFTSAASAARTTSWFSTLLRRTFSVEDVFLELALEVARRVVVGHQECTVFALRDSDAYVLGVLPHHLGEVT